MQGVSSSKNFFESDHLPILGNSDCDYVGGFEREDDSKNCGTYSFKNMEGDSTEESEVCDAILKCINQALMEDDWEEKVNFIQESDLHNTEKYFSDVLVAESESHPSSTSHFTSYRLSSAQNSPIQNNFRSDTSSIFPPNGTVNGLMSSVAGVANTEFSPIALKQGFPVLDDKKEEVHSMNGSERGKKKFYIEDESEEERSKKRSMTCTLETVLHEMLETLMLHDNGNDEPSLCNHEQSEVSNCGNRITKKSGSKRGVVDMKTLLFQCAKAITGNDLSSANELLRQIRWHSSPYGNEFQRMSHYFADSFDARLAGTGNVLHTALKPKYRSDINCLKAYHHYVLKFPFVKTWSFLLNRMIVEQAEKASSIHIIDFDISHGLQWLTLIQRLSKRADGPPKIRITGIGIPELGFRPATMIEKAGVRLANHCERLSVPFEYNCIAKVYETIHVEDIKIEEDEMLFVYCPYKFMYLFDDSVVENNHRDAVLNLIRRLNPDMFIHGIVNGAFNSPYLFSRFREAFFFFSSLFDMFQANLPQEDPERILFEREVYGRDILNVIACEGSDRVLRPETCKQWHARHVRAGFVQLPLKQEHMKKAKAMVRSNYHEDFLLDEQNQWMVQGWKGRVLYALSFWKPA